MQKQDNIAAHITTERAVDELRRLGGVMISNNGHDVGNLPVESLTEENFAQWRNGARLLITAARAKSLGLGEKDSTFDASGFSFAELMSIADPVLPSSLPRLSPIDASPIDSLALKLAKQASLLPALLLVPASEATHAWLALDAQNAIHAMQSPLIDIVETAQATLPIEQSEQTRIVSFRSRYSTSVHLALIIGDPKKEEAPLARIHSSCVTGDILGSLRCDCGDQLKMALQQISDVGNGVLLYLHQEGRGIGITNKLRAYALQERGVDTYEANRLLGFGEDERDFSIAGAILKRLGISRIRMLTNNPHKMDALKQAGIAVLERVPLIAASGRHNHDYLQTKAKKSGHLF